jgi:hypothetical protein
MSLKRQKRRLQIVAVAIGAFGPVFFLGSMAPTLAPARLTLDLLGWRLDRPSSFEAQDTRFLSALAGGFLMGWGVTIWCLASWVFEAAPDGVRRAVLAGTLAWFCVDSAGSALSGSPSNVAFNLLVLILAAGPLVRGGLGGRPRGLAA